MGVGVAEGAEPVVVFLAGSIPQRELNVLSVHLDIGDVVLEHSRDVNLCIYVRVEFVLPGCEGVPRLLHRRRQDGGRELETRTSGKVPLEKTIKRQVCGREESSGEQKEKWYDPRMDG